MDRPNFSVLAADAVPSLSLFIDGTQCLPLYRYTDDGERVSNITDWGLRRINEHYRKEFGERFEEAVGAERITAEDVFAYTYAVLHDPVYRHDYAVDLLREFPRLPLYHDWDAWVKMGCANCWSCISGLRMWSLTRWSGWISRGYRGQGQLHRG